MINYFKLEFFFQRIQFQDFYDVNIYQIKNKVIISEKNIKIIVKKAGISNKIFQFAHDQTICLWYIVYSVCSIGGFNGCNYI